MKTLFAFTFIVLTIFVSCTKTTTDTSVPIAVYTIGSGGNCTGATISGRYVADTALTSTNTVAITVDVTLAGPYWISTNTVNGISFSGIGTFTSTGPQTAVLTGTGTPIAIDSVSFIVKALNGLGDSCSFSITTVQGIPPHYYLTCFLNGVYRNFSDSAGGTNSSFPGSSGAAGLDIRGLDTIINSTSKIELGVGNATAVGAGSYTDTGTVKSYFIYVDSLAQTWSVNTTSQPSFTINVTSVSAGNVQGTFSGTIKNQTTSTDSITVTNGLFSVPVQ